MADIRIKDMPDLSAGIPRDQVYLAIDEASKTYRILLSDIAVPEVSAAINKQAVTFTSGTSAIEWGYVSGTAGGDMGSMQFNNNGFLDGFGIWNGFTFQVPGLNVTDRFTIKTDDVVIAPFTSAGFDGVRINIGEGTTAYKTMMQRVDTSAGETYLQLICDRTGGIEFVDSENIYSRQSYASFGPTGNRYFLLTRADKGILLGDAVSPTDTVLYYTSADKEVKFQESSKTAYLISNPRALNYTLNANLSSSGFDGYWHRNGKVGFTGTVDATSATFEISIGTVLFTIDDIEARPGQDTFLFAPVSNGTWTSTQADAVSLLIAKPNGDVVLGDDIATTANPFRIWMDGVSFQTSATVII
jgi:hypothetical protein